LTDRTGSAGGAGLEQAASTIAAPRVKSTVRKDGWRGVVDMADLMEKYAETSFND
jgi:hypothetical protein